MTDVYPGMLIRHINDEERFGSIGVLAKIASVDTGTRYLITCAHVAAPFYVNNGPQRGDAIVNEDGIEIGSLVGWTLDDNAVELLADAALVELNTNVSLSPAIKKRFPITGVGKFLIDGMTVQLLGQDDKTRQSAEISRTSVSTRVRVTSGPYGPAQLYKLVNLVECAKHDGSFGSGSDSGSIVFNERGRALGLITSSDHRAGKSYFVRISTVLAELKRVTGLDLEILTVDRTVPPASAGLPKDPIPAEEPPHVTDALSGQAIDVVARTLWGEARSEFNRFGNKAYQAICEVILTRARRLATHRGKTLEARHLIDVCKERKQFSCWNAGLSDYKGARDPNYERLVAVKSGNRQFDAALKITESFFFKKMHTHYTNEATHYYNPRVVHPKWAREATWSVDIGNHRFVKGVRHFIYSPVMGGVTR